MVFALAGCLLWLGNSLVAGFALLAALLLGAALVLPSILEFVLSLGQRFAHGALTRWFWADSRQQLSGLSLALMALLLGPRGQCRRRHHGRKFHSDLRQLARRGGWRRTSMSTPPAICRRTRSRPGCAAGTEVEAILPGGRADTQFNGAPIEVLGLPDHPIYRQRWPLLESADKAWIRLRAGDTCLVSEQLMRRLDLAIGDHIEVPAPGGDWPLEIVGIYADYGNPKGQIAVNIAALLRRFPETPQTRLGLLVGRGQIPALIAALQEKFALDDRSVADQATVESLVETNLQPNFRGDGGTQHLHAGRCGIALLTSLLTLSNSRLPQLAPLWATGITRAPARGDRALKTMSVALITALLRCRSVFWWRGA